MHTYIHTHIHTHTHAYMHTQARAQIHANTGYRLRQRLADVNQVRWPEPRDVASGGERTAEQGAPTGLVAARYTTSDRGY